MGSGAFKQDMSVVFDTGSDWLIVEVEECATCLQNRYETALSEAFVKLQGTYGERLYGSLSTSGYEALDTVCFTSDPNHCVENFQWFAVTFQDGGLAPFKDGILGLTTVYNQFITGPSLVWQMYEQSIIEEPVFAFYLAGPNEDSYFDAGVI